MGSCLYHMLRPMGKYLLQKMGQLDKIIWPVNLGNLFLSPSTLTVAYWPLNRETMMAEMEMIQKPNRMDGHLPKYSYCYH